MGSGMLWAAIGGAAKAGTDIMDDRIKADQQDRQRKQSIADRRDSLLYEMDLKSKMAQQEEDRAATASNKIVERAAQIGTDRGVKELERARGMVPAEGEFANDRITPDMLESMPPAARAIYEKEMGLTDDTRLQAMRDQLTASSEIGAPASVKKGLLDSYKEEGKAEKDRMERERKERNDAARDDLGYARLAQQSQMQQNQFAQQMALSERRIEAAASRASSGSGRGGSAKPDEVDRISVLKDVYAKVSSSAPKQEDYKFKKPGAYEDAVKAWSGTDEGQIATKALKQINRQLDGATSTAPAPSAPPAPKTAAPQSTIKDNQSIPRTRPKPDLKDVTAADIAATAKRYNVSEAEVKRRLGMK